MVERLSVLFQAAIDKAVECQIDHMNTIALRGWAETSLPSTRTQFIVRIALHIIKMFAIEARKAVPMAAQTYRDFTRDSRTRFGDPAYAWDDNAARTLVLEYWRNA